MRPKRTEAVAGSRLTQSGAGEPGMVSIVSTVVPFFGLTNSILGILKGNPQKGTTRETVGMVGFRVRGFEFLRLRGSRV